MNTCTSKTTSFWKERKNLILNFSTPFSFPDFSTHPPKSLQPTIFWLIKSWALFLSISSSSNSLYTWVSISTLFSLLLLFCCLGPFLLKPFGSVSLSKPFFFFFFCFQNHHLYFFFFFIVCVFSLSIYEFDIYRLLWEFSHYLPWESEDLRFSRPRHRPRALAFR